MTTKIHPMALMLCEVLVMTLALQFGHVVLADTGPRSLETTVVCATGFTIMTLAPAAFVDVVITAAFGAFMIGRPKIVGVGPTIIVLWACGIPAIVGIGTAWG